MNTALIKIFLPLRLRCIRNSLAASTWRRWAEVTVSLLILTGVEWVTYHLFLVAFDFLLRQGEIGRLILERLFNMGWAVIFFLLVISNLITAFSTFYRSREVEYLFSTPLSHEEVFRGKLADNLLFSSWAILIVGLPMMAAFGTVKDMAFDAILLLSGIGLLPLILIAGGLAMLVTVVLARVSRIIRLRTSFVLLLLFVAGVIMIYRQFNQTNLVVAGDVTSMRYISRYTANLSRIPFPMLPGYWFGSLFGALKNGNLKDLLFFGGLLVTSALLLRELLLVAVRRWFYSGWQILQARSRIVIQAGTSSSLLLKPWLEKDSSRALLAKEILQFIRTPQQWIQFLLFLLMVIIYVGNLARIQYTLQGAGGFWMQLLSILNFGFSGFILASLITRFVFPLVSLEGRNRWILLSAPITIWQVLSQKFWLSALIFFLIAELIALISGILLRQGTTMIVISSVMLFLMSITLTSLSLGLGAIFPLYHETNPMRIVSGIGGIIAILVSLAYLGIKIIVMVVLLRILATGHLGWEFWGLVAGVLIFNGLVNYFPLYLGRQAFARN